MERDGVWSTDNENGLMIESLHRWRPELTESRPALILKEGEWRWLRLGIGDQAGVEYRSGKLTFGGYWTGTHTIFAVANGGREAQTLAIETMKCLLWFSSQIIDALELQRFVPVSIGSVSALKESTENYVVPLTVAYAVPEFWTLQEEAPRIKRITWRTSQVLAGY